MGKPLEITQADDCNPMKKNILTATTVHKLILRVHAQTITQEIFHKAVQHMRYNLLFSILFLFFFPPMLVVIPLILFHDPPMSHKTVCKALSQGQHCLFQADKLGFHRFSQEHTRAGAEIQGGSNIGGAPIFLRITAPFCLLKALGAHSKRGGNAQRFT